MRSMAELTYHYGLKVQIYPSPRQREIIGLNCNISRFIYNKMIEINLELYHLKQVKGVYIKQVDDRINQLNKRLKTLAEMKNCYPFLYDTRIDSNAIANAKRNYRAAWNMYRKIHAQQPKFHKKTATASYQTSTNYAPNADMTPFSGSARFVGLNHLNLPKLGVVKITGSQARLLKRKSDIRIGTITIIKDNDNKYYASLSLGSDTPFVKTLPATNKNVGVDLNIDNFLTTSDGTMVENPKFYRKSIEKLQKAQRIMSRRQTVALKSHRKLRDCKNYQKARLQVAKISKHVFNQRKNFIDSVVIYLLRNYDVIVAEDLLGKNMLKNHALAMSISDVGWRQFLNRMAQKAQMHGKTFIMVDPKNTTQKCSACGHIMGTDDTEKLTLKERAWECPKCHTQHIRDWNAAINILNRGLKTLTIGKQRIHEDSAMVTNAVV